MHYEFREKKSKTKHTTNKREKCNIKKEDTKNKKIKQKHIISKQGDKEKREQIEKGEDVNLTRNDINIDEKTSVETGYISGKIGSVFTILNKKKSVSLNAKINEEIPSHLKKTLIVGDIVYYINSKDKKNKQIHFTIEKRGERKNYLSKTQSNTSRFGAQKEQIIAANIDVALIVVPVKKPKFDYKLVDRYLILCQNRGVTPIICLNKIDLTDKRDPLLLHYKTSGIKILEVSTIEKKGLIELQETLKNKTAILLGKSGVGKSSIINTISSEFNLLTQDVNKKSGEGKHTTTRSNLYQRTKDSYIIDTPGIRALGIDQITKKDLQQYFPEFIKYKGMCKYSKCLHQTEPDCAIKNAVEKKEINKHKYESYLRILKDLI